MSNDCTIRSVKKLYCKLLVTKVANSVLKVNLIASQGGGGNMYGSSTYYPGLLQCVWRSPNTTENMSINRMLSEAKKASFSGEVYSNIGISMIEC